MKSLRLYGPRDIRFEEAEEPAVKNALDVKIRIKSVGICGSDMHRYALLGPYIKGMIWGHEFSGEVVELGDKVTDFRIGQKVTACPALYCGECDSCKQGKYAQCHKLSVIGAYCPGAFAEYIVMPRENVVKVPENISFDAAAVIEPSCVAIHGYYNAGGIKAGDTVAVLGCGTVGTMAVQWAKIMGAKKVIAIDISDKKLETAQQAGADNTINATGIEPYKEVYNLTDNKGVDVAVEAAGTVETSAQVLALPGKGGKVIYMGIPYGDVMIKRLYFEKIVRNELSIVGTWNAISGPFPGKEWETCVDFLKEGKLQTECLITHRLPLEKGPKAFEMATEGREYHGKIIFHP